jgi:glycosyltransferase involved in cell wall biosynthesis
VGGVVYVLRAFPEPSETFVRNEIRALRRLGVPVSVLAGWRSQPPAADWSQADAVATPVTVLTEQTSLAIPGAKLAGMLSSDVAGFAPRKAARTLRLAALAQAAVSCLPAGTSILHAHFANDAAVLARYLARLTDIPYRLTAHAYDLYQDPFLLDRNLRFASRILTVSEANKVFLEKRLRARKLADKAVEVVRCGIDLERFAYRDPKALGEHARLLCVARLVAKKGHATLLDAVAAMRRDGSNVTLDIAGDGPLERELRARAEREDLEGAVRFLGTVSHDAVREAMLASDAVVLASRVAADGDRDGIPVALIEAMALGIPVVSTSASGIPELITPGTGRLAPPGDPEALARAIRDTLLMPQDTRWAQTRAARREITQRFDIDQIATRLAPVSP